MQKTGSAHRKITVQPGLRVGRLTVANATPERKNGYVIWECICDCGGRIFLDTRTLQRETVRDCGCETKIRPGQKDLTGMRFGRLVCLEPTGQHGRNGGIVWRCICDCGNTCLAVSTQLTHGYKKSCGCLSHPKQKEFAGRRFGMLTVVEYAGKRDGMHRWKCRCDCGNETVVGQTLLQSGKTKSCGCRRREVIKDTLQLVEGTSLCKLRTGKNQIISTNTSGYTGVYQQKKTGKWVAQIGFKGKQHYLGTFDTIEDAAEARKLGEKLYEELLEQYDSAGDSQEPER